MRLTCFLIVLLGAVLTGCERTNGSFACNSGVPGGDEYALTETIAQHIKKNYPILTDRTADKTKQGRIYYVRPGCVPSFTFYEIVEPSDILLIEELAKQSLGITGIERVRLTFYEKQNWVMSANGGGHRGHEKTIKSLTVTKSK